MDVTVNGIKYRLGPIITNQPMRYFIHDGNIIANNNLIKIRPDNKDTAREIAEWEYQHILTNYNESKYGKKKVIR